MSNFQERLRERIAWLGRMPLHWKLLFASQAIIMTFGVSYRNRVVQDILEQERLEQEREERAKLLLEMRDNRGRSS